MRAAWLLLQLCAAALGARFKGSVDLAPGQPQSLTFLGLFCFEKTKGEQTHSGALEVKLQTTRPDNETVQHMQLLLYDDEPDSWPEVYPYHGLTCEEWTQRAKNKYDARYSVEFRNGTYFITDTVTQRARPRFWYLALSVCTEVVEYESIWYDIHFYQAQKGRFSREFGMNEMGINIVFALVTAFYSFLLLLECVAVCKFFYREGYLHPLIRLFVLVVVLQWVYCLMYCIHYAYYTYDGVGRKGLSRMGDLFYILARTVFMLQLLLLASGWTIVEGPVKNKCTLLASVLLLAVTWILVTVWENRVVDEEDTSMPDPLVAMYYVLATLWVFVGIFFCVTCVKSYRRENSRGKKSLFCQLGFFYGFWFLALPTISISAHLLLEPWVRTKLVIIFTLCETTLGIGVMAALLWPSRAGDYFKMETPRELTAALQHYQIL